MPQPKRQQTPALPKDGGQLSWFKYKMWTCILQVSRKEDIIIELGGEWVRVGLVADRTPRKTIPSDVLSSYLGSIPQHEYEIKVEEVLYSIFYTHINSSCLNKTVILLEKVYTDRRILEAVAKILFKKFKIDKLEFGLSCITPLYLTGRFSGIVISGGSTCVEIMPVYESYPLMQSFKYIPSGTQAMTKVIKDEILLTNSDVPNDVLDRLNNEYLNDLKNLYSNMNIVQSKSEQTITLNIKKSKLKLKPSVINYSNIFGNPQNQQYNIAHLFLQSLSQISPQMLDTIAGNVVFAGGMWRIKGMQQYFKKRVSEAITRFPKLENAKIGQKIKIVNWGFNPSEVSWIGCSVGASVKAIDSLFLKKAEYESEGFTQKIMSNYFLSY